MRAVWNVGLSQSTALRNICEIQEFLNCSSNFLNYHVGLDLNKVEYTSSPEAQSLIGRIFSGQYTWKISSKGTTLPNIYEISHEEDPSDELETLCRAICQIKTKSSTIISQQVTGN